MASPDWFTIYFHYPAPKLEAEIQRLREAVENPYSNTSGGGVSSSRDMALLAAQLDGATRAQAARAGRSKNRTLTTFA